ncbi:MAG: Rid family hydrolase [Bilophila wadsworthia]
MREGMRQTVSATGAPAAVGSYSQAVKAGNLLFLSGQLCANPETGRFERESVAAQTRRIMENIKAIIEEAGGTLDAVVHCRAFLSDMKHFRNSNLSTDRIFPLLSGTDDRRQRRHIRRP